MLEVLRGVCAGPCVEGAARPGRLRRAARALSEPASERPPARDRPPSKTESRRLIEIPLLHRRVPAGPGHGSVRRLHAHARRDCGVAGRGRSRAPGDRAAPAGAPPPPGAPALPTAGRGAAALPWAPTETAAGLKSRLIPLADLPRPPAHGHRPVRPRARDGGRVRHVEPRGSRSRPGGPPELSVPAPI